MSMAAPRCVPMAAHTLLGLAVLAALLLAAPGNALGASQTASGTTSRRTGRPVPPRVQTSGTSNSVRRSSAATWPGSLR